MKDPSLRLRFDRVNVVVAEPELGLREDIRRALRKIGFDKIKLTASILDIQLATETGQLDLLIGDTTMADGDFTDVVKNIRAGTFAGDIYPVVITLVSDASPETVDKVLGSGTDGVIIKPCTSEQLHKLILTLVEKRGRFVVSSDYIGPDRRKKPREGAVVIPSTRVPNPLYNKITGYYNDDEYQVRVRRTNRVLNELRIERQCAQVKYYMETILPTYEGKGIESGMPPEWERLVFTTHDLSRRAKDSRFAHMHGATKILYEFVDEVSVKGHVVADDVNILTHLASSVSRLFETD